MIGSRVAASASGKRGRTGPSFFHRRTVATFITLALALGLVGTCPCAAATADACAGSSRHAASTAHSCCGETSSGLELRAAGCCEAPEAGEHRAVTPRIGTLGPASIFDLPGHLVVAASAARSALSGVLLPSLPYPCASLVLRI